MKHTATLGVVANLLKSLGLINFNKFVILKSNCLKSAKYFDKSEYMYNIAHSSISLLLLLLSAIS